MRYLALALVCALLALPAEAGRRRGNAEPVMVYFPPSPGVDPAETYLVQIPMRHDGWQTVLEVEQGSCLRYDKKLVGNAPPYWLRACWASEPDLCTEAVDCPDPCPYTESDCLSIR